MVHRIPRKAGEPESKGAGIRACCTLWGIQCCWHCPSWKLDFSWLFICHQRGRTSSISRASLVAQRIKCLSAMWETGIQSLGWEDPLEKEMATHSSTLAWRIPWQRSLEATVHGVTESRTRLSKYTPQHLCLSVSWSSSLKCDWGIGVTWNLGKWVSTFIQRGLYKALNIRLAEKLVQIFYTILQKNLNELFDQPNIWGRFRWLEIKKLTVFTVSGVFCYSSS